MRAEAVASVGPARRAGLRLGPHRDLVESGIDTEVRIGTLSAAERPTYDRAVEWGFVRACLTKLGKWTGDPRWY